MQKIEQYVKKKFDAAKQSNVEASMSVLEQEDRKVFSKIQKVLESQGGYSAEKMPSGDFADYIRKVKEIGKDKVSELDRYKYFKDAVPKKIYKIHDNMKKLANKDDKLGDAPS